jgi:hypothetical protein
MMSAMVGRLGITLELAKVSASFCSLAASWG